MRLLTQIGQQFTLQLDGLHQGALRIAQNTRVLRLDPVARDILIEVLAQLRTDAQVRGGTAVARGIVEEWSNYFTMGEPRFTGLSDDMRVVMARLQARL